MQLDLVEICAAARCVNKRKLAGYNKDDERYAKMTAKLVKQMQINATLHTTLQQMPKPKKKKKNNIDCCKTLHYCCHANNLMILFVRCT